MDSLLLLSLTILAAWRLTELLMFDTIFRPLREWFGIPHTQEGTPLGLLEDNGCVRNFFGQLLTCVRCTSVWVGGLIGGVWVFLTASNVLLWPLITLALSQTTIILNNLNHRLQ